MREVIPERLWIGNAGDARDPGRVLDADVAALVNLAAEELPPTLPRDILYCHFPLVDGPGNSPSLLKIAVGTVVSLLREDIPTLVYCGAGMSRSVTVAAGAVARWRGDPLEQTLTMLAAIVPHDVSPALWRDLKSVVELTVN